MSVPKTQTTSRPPSFRNIDKLSTEQIERGIVTVEPSVLKDGEWYVVLHSNEYVAGVFRHVYANAWVATREEADALAAVFKDLCFMKKEGT